MVTIGLGGVRYESRRQVEIYLSHSRTICKPEFYDLEGLGSVPAFYPHHSVLD
jgi:hypothetical protein